MKTICITPKAVAKNCKYDKYGDFSNKDAQWNWLFILMSINTVQL
jgi:hypothetical protein